VSLGPANDAKEQVRQAVDIVDLVGSYVPLRRQGRNYVGHCPWHDDRRPSLQVNPERQSFKCWVCDVGGDVFSFVMKMENIEFREALEFLAERAGVSLQRSEPGGPPPRSEDDKRAQLRTVAWAEEQFHRCLLEAPEAEPAREYLADRGITPETIRRFHLGYSPHRWEWLLDRARGTEFTPALLERVGLVVRRELEGGHYDRFRGRVIFSIRDARGRPIAFGGRVLPQLAEATGPNSAKYINSPETPLFSKSRELYGLDVARDAIARDRQAIVMEGYTDCIMAHQFGLANVVAVLGTALGEGHLQVLRRLTDSVVLVLDGDAAGRRRTNEIIDTLLALFVKNQVDLRILTLPEGVDPCDFIVTHGGDALRQLLAGAVDALEHKFQAVTQGLDTTTDTHRAAQAVEQVLSTLAQIRTAAATEAASPVLLREQQMLGRIARRFRMPEEQLRNRLAALRRAARPKAWAKRVEAGASALEGPHATPALSAWERGILELVLLDPSLLSRIEAAVEPAAFDSPVARRIFEACVGLHQVDQPVNFQRLTLEFDDVNTKSVLVQLDESSQAKASADREQWLQDLLAGVERRKAAVATTCDDAEAELARFYQASRSKQLGEYERRKK